jgi:Cu-Zn family superoxide dismutase
MKSHVEPPRIGDVSQKESSMKSPVIIVAGLAFAAAAYGAETTVALSMVDAKGTGDSVGTVRIVETRYGLVFKPALTGLPPGLHGFHVHEKPSCASGVRDGVVTAALAAGDHLDPQATKRHGEPWGDGHLGDLPGLYVASDGSASNPVLAPRLKLADVANRSLMVHAGGDNHSDHPAPLGGGGARLACGVIG